MEHRWGDRRQVILRVRLEGPGPNSTMGWLTDVSLSGAFVRTIAAFAPMSTISIEVDERNIDRSRLWPLRLQGRVVRHDPAGIGVEWEEFASGTLGEIVRLAPSLQRPRIDLTRQAAPSLGVRTPRVHATADEERSSVPT